MNKPLLVLSAPVFTASGYGAHSRDILQSLRNLDKFDIRIVSQRWGETPFTMLRDDSEFAVWARSIVIHQLPKKPDVWIQITVPNEFKAVGEFNIGITAGTEANIAPKSFVDGCNNMDLIIVPSEFVKTVLTNTEYDEVDKATNQLVNKYRINKPIKVLFEGVDESVFGKSYGHDILSDVKEDFVYLFVGHWLKGAPGEDRKDIYTLIDTFCATFKDTPKEKQPALVLKTSSATPSIIDREIIKEKIEWVTNKFNNPPPIYLLHGELTNDEMTSLYHHNKVKVFTSLTKGEGYGRPMCEFTFTGKPVIASNWSGQLDFLRSKEYSYLVDGQLTKLHQSVVDDFLIKEGSWYTVSATEACKALFDVWKNYSKWLKKSKALEKLNRKEFSLSAMDSKLKDIFDTDVKVKEYKQIVLPSLTKL
jgi:glycosyltransferase involved in cell wall biosynthesis